MNALGKHHESDLYTIQFFSTVHLDDGTFYPIYKIHGPNGISNKVFDLDTAKITTKELNKKVRKGSNGRFLRISRRKKCLNG